MDEKEMLEVAAERIRGELWAHAGMQDQYVNALDNAAWSLYCVLAGTPSDRVQCLRRWAEILENKR